MTVSLRPADFAPQRLMCLFEALKQRYPGRDLEIVLFSAHDAARGWTPSTVERNAWVDYANSKLHALYSFRKSDHEEYFLIVPDGLRLGADGYNTRVDLPATDPIVCKLSIDGRCLLEFADIKGTLFGTEEPSSGHITVSGKIGRDGSVKNVVAVTAEVKPSDARQILTDWSIRNVRSLHFEPAETETDLQITYHFDAVGPEPAPQNVQFRLPREVTTEGAHRIP